MRTGLLLLFSLSLGLAAAAEAPAPEAATRARAEALFNEALGSSHEARITALTEAVRLCEEEARYWVALGDTYRILDPATPAKEGEPPAAARPVDLVQARRIYEQAIRFAPQSPLPHLRLAELYWENDRATAATHLDQAMALDPENALPVYLRAALHFAAGESAPGRQRLLDARRHPEMRLPVVMPTTELTVLQASNFLRGVSFVSMQHLRALAREIVKAAGELQNTATEDHIDPRILLTEGQRLAYRIMAGEPRNAIALLVGLAIDTVVSEPLDGILRGRADADGLLRLQRRKEAREALKARVKEELAALQERQLAALAQPDKKLRVLHEEAALVEKLLKESGLKETMDD
ncbi:MAG: hypothetical protein GX774_12490 [Armatimonadetes bacterium]|jgi:tetratricopeptide (TPR) repeat protein|nr:hypothetical protein [Armatimonadota bacterium]